MPQLLLQAVTIIVIVAIYVDPDVGIKKEELFIGNNTGKLDLG